MLRRVRFCLLDRAWLAFYISPSEMRQSLLPWLVSRSLERRVAGRLYQVSTKRSFHFSKSMLYFLLAITACARVNAQTSEVSQQSENIQERARSSHRQAFQSLNSFWLTVDYSTGAVFYCLSWIYSISGILMSGRLSRNYLASNCSR